MAKSSKERSVDESPVLASRGMSGMVLFVVLALPIAALALQTWRLYPFVDEVNLELSTGDDWFFYKRLALDAIHDGVELPRKDEVYRRPAGFLYIYFVALVFRLLGENATMVYVVQGTMLGLSTAVVFVVATRLLSGWSRWVFLVALVLMMYYDVSRWYTQKLLSENLLMILLPWFLLFAIRSVERRSARDALVAGILGGFCHLARPNALLVVPAVAAVLAWHVRQDRRRAAALVVVFLGGASLANLPLVVRNVYVTRDVTLETFSPLFAKTNDWAYRMNTPRNREERHREEGSGIEYYSERILFVLGITRYGVVKHWIAIWAGVGVVIGFAIRRRCLDFRDAIMLSMVAVYFGPMTMFGGIYSYGARMVLPMLPVALLLSFRGLDLVVEVLKKKAGGTRSGSDRSRQKRFRSSRPA